MLPGKKNINRILMLISLAALFWVGYKLWTFEAWGSFADHLRENKYQIPGVLLFQAILMTLNLTLETRKWQMLVRPVSKTSFKDSLAQVIKGIQLGMVTPARSGDSVGKSLFFGPANRSKVIVLSLAGSIIQNFVILFAALWALIWTTHSTSDYLPFFNESLFGSLPFIWIAIASAALITGGWLIFKKFVITETMLHKIRQHLRLLKQLSRESLIKILLLTTIRYGVFSLQFLILLHFFGLDSIRDGLYAIFIFYGALSFIPSAGAGDLSIRATLAIMIFGSTAVAGPGVVMASLLLWFFNLALPALLPSAVFMAITFSPKLQKYSLHV
jgi:hypothetical protein